MWKQKAKWIHFIGIGGIGVGQLAVAYHKKGYMVTGSDDGPYEPMKSFLGKYPDIKLNKGFHFSHLILNDDEIPERVIAAGGFPRNNKEILFAKKREIKVENFAEVFEKELVVDESIVVAGSFGKTTTTAILVSIFREAGKDISYMFGGMVAGFENGVELKIDSTEYSIVEGDEYISARDDMQSKFFHYKPKYLVLTGYAYDHTDIFKTPEDYYENFEKLVKELPGDGLLVFNKKYAELEELAKSAKCKTIPYKYSEAVDLPDSNLIGDFNKENILAAMTLAGELGIDEKYIRKAVENFGGVKRRLEIVHRNEHEGNEVVLVDDFGSTPGKAESAIAAIRKDFPDHNVFVFFEPNIGSRTSESVPNYKTTFSQATKPYLLPFHQIKQKGILSQKQFADELLDKMNVHINRLNSIEEMLWALEENLKDNSKPSVLLFLSSHDIQEYVSAIKQGLVK